MTTIDNRPMIDLDQKRQLVDDFYDRLLAYYGYDKRQLGRDVVIHDGRTADIAIWRSEQSREANHLPDIRVVVVCKAEHLKIQVEDYVSTISYETGQAENFVVCHNMKETRVYYIDSGHGGSIEQFDDFPKATDIATDDGIKAFVGQMRNRSKDDLLQAFNRCHNIIRNYDKLSPEAAFDEISKVIFIKILYERKPDNELIYTKEKYLRDESLWQKTHKNGDYMAHLFDSVKTQYADDGLFDKNEALKIKRDSFLMILTELGTISLVNISEDVKGIAFESFLGKTFRGELGQFFTPRTIVNYMVDVLDVREGELVCDPCCGSGGFLIRAFEKVQDDIDRDIHLQISNIAESNKVGSEKRQAIDSVTSEFDKGKNGSRYYKLCHEYFYGVDANVRMARTSKMNMIMHGDGHVGVYLHDGLMDVGNVKEGVFDVVLINPPFGVHIDRKMKVNEHYTIDDVYEQSGSNAELLFVERCIRLLKPGGRAGLVLPEGVFNNTNSATKKLRAYVERHTEILNITSIPADVFLASGANIKPSILFIRKRHKYGHQATICASKVTDAGINSQGLPSDNRQLQELAPIVRDWIKTGEFKDSPMMRLIPHDSLDDWNVQPYFNIKPVRFKEGMPTMKLGDVLKQSHQWTMLDDDTEYIRITVKLFNKGIVERDRQLGKRIGTKRQMVVREGQFVVSKIDGKSGAFAFLPKCLDGAIVTQDFPVFDVDESLVLADYLELVLSNQSMLEQIKATCSGSTGRKRLSVAKFLNTQIPVPSLGEQRKCVGKLIRLREEQKRLEQLIAAETQQINNSIFE